MINAGDKFNVGTQVKVRGDATMIVAQVDWFDKKAKLLTKNEYAICDTSKLTSRPWESFKDLEVVK